MRRAHILGAIAAVMLPFVTPSSARAQTLFGHVLDRLSGRRLPSAAVVMLDSAGKTVGYALSDSTGRFVLKAPRAGRYHVYVDQLAYRPLMSDTFDLRKGERWETLLWVVPDPVALDPVAVTVRRETAALKKVGFYERQKIGAGYLIGPEKIRAERPVETHQLLWGVPGVQVAPNPMGTGSLILSTRPHRLSPTGTCPMTIFVDGHRFEQKLVAGGDSTVGEPGITMDDMVDAQDVLAVEVYPHGGIGAPIQYAGLDTDCGIVLIWTKEKR